MTEIFQCSTFLRVFLTAFFSSAWDVFSFSIGEKGRQAFEKMDRICCELRDTVQQEAEIEITVF